MANVLSNVGYVGYAVETVEGDLTAPNIFLPVSSFSFDSTNDFIMPDQIRGSRDRSIAMVSPYSVSGSMDMELVPNGIRPLLKSAVAASGTINASAYSGGGYQTVFTPGSAEDTTFSFESSAADILIMRYGGLRVNTLEISAAFGEIVTSTWGFEGTTRAKQTGTSTESYAAVYPFHFTGASISIDGSEAANVKNFSFSVGNNLDRIGTLRKTRDWYRSSFGMRDVGLSATMDFQNTNEYDLFLAEAEFAVLLHLEGASLGTSKETLAISIPRVRWNMVNAPLTAGDFIEQSVEATILRPLNGDPIFTLTVVNSEGTAV
jgi:hypothetical protein